MSSLYRIQTARRLNLLQHNCRFKLGAPALHELSPANLLCKWQSHLTLVRSPTVSRSQVEKDDKFLAEEAGPSWKDGSLEKKEPGGRTGKEDSYILPDKVKREETVQRATVP